MPVIDVQENAETLTLRLTARFDAPPQRVWQVWADPRQLERWWGPPMYPATVVDHDLTPGGSVTYFMTGPEGDKHYGWWRIMAVAAPHRLEFEDGFGDDSGRPNPDLPTTTVVVELSADTSDTGATATVMTVESAFGSLEAMEQMAAMGMVEGITQAMNQVDGLLAGTTS